MSDDDLLPGCSPIISVIIRDGKNETEFRVDHEYMDTVIEFITFECEAQMVDEEWSAVTS